MNTAVRQPGYSKFTVADNVFIKVWRRSPRVAEVNTATFQQLLYQWGFTRHTSPLPNNKPGE